MWTYYADIIEVVDGDTVKARCDVGFGMWKKDSFRLEGIDTPEVRTKDLVEKAEGLKVKAWLEEQVANAKEILIHTTKKDKYGRWLAQLIIDGRIINEELLQKGMAKPYGS